MNNKKLGEKTIRKFYIYCPWYAIRDGIENVLRANTGGLIVLVIMKR